MADVELSALLRRLALPVYVPTVLYSGRAAAIVPVVPLVGLRLGMTVPQVATLGTLAGVLAVIGPLPTGRLVHALGERAALIVGALVAIASIVGCLVAVTGLEQHRRRGRVRRSGHHRGHDVRRVRRRGQHRDRRAGARRGGVGDRLGAAVRASPLAPPLKRYCM